METRAALAAAGVALEPVGWVSEMFRGHTERKTITPKDVDWLAVAVTVVAELTSGAPLKVGSRYCVGVALTMVNAASRMPATADHGLAAVAMLSACTELVAGDGARFECVSDFEAIAESQFVRTGRCVRGSYLRDPACIRATCAMGLLMHMVARCTVNLAVLGSTRIAGMLYGEFADLTVAPAPPGDPTGPDDELLRARVRSGAMHLVLAGPIVQMVRGAGSAGGQTRADILAQPEFKSTFTDETQKHPTDVLMLVAALYTSVATSSDEFETWVAKPFGPLLAPATGLVVRTMAPLVRLVALTSGFAGVMQAADEWLGDPPADEGPAGLAVRLLRAYVNSDRAGHITDASSTMAEWLDRNPRATPMWLDAACVAARVYAGVDDWSGEVVGLHVLADHARFPGSNELGLALYHPGFPSPPPPPADEDPTTTTM